MKVVAVVGGVVLALLGALMVAAMVDIAGTTPCEDVAQRQAIGEDLTVECFDGSASEKTVVLVLGLAAAAAAIVAFGLTLYYAARDRGGRLAAAFALAAVVLTALTLVI